MAFLHRHVQQLLTFTISSAIAETAVQGRLGYLWPKVKD